ncbi:MAG: hypothetical protein ACOYL8_04340 [Patescibacteria group bacterium]
MTNLFNFLKKNFLVIVLLITVVVLLVLYFGKSSKTSAPKITEEQKTLVPTNPIKTDTIVASVPAKTIEVKMTLFCLRLDGNENRHLPALMGSKASEAYPNGLKGGYNWDLSWDSNGTEPYGIMPDGTLFAKESFLKQWGMNSYVELKCDATNWQALKLSKSTVNKEPAYVYKLK